MMIETTRVVDWLTKLVQIPSVNLAQVGLRAGVGGELAMAEALAGWFREFGADEVEMEHALPNRPNVMAMWRGQTDKWVALDVHMDVVGVEQMTDEPFDGRVENGRVWGRGAVDTKASFAVILAMLEQMKATGEKFVPNFLIVATSDEENGANGARLFAEWVRRKGLKISQLMVAEPTMCAPVYGHKGFMSLEFVVRGQTAHSSKPHLGKNAIQAAAHVIVALEKEHERLQSLTPETELGNATLSVTIIEGGKGLNVIPDECVIKVSKRMVPGEEPEEDFDHLLAVAKAASPLPVTLNPKIGLSAFYQSPDSVWVQQLSQWSGEAPEIVPYGTNALSYDETTAAEIVIFGPGSIDQAHGEIEWVEIAELEKLVGIYQKWLFE